MTRAKKILLVEDERHISKGLMFNLKREGYDMALAENGESALDYFSQGGFDMMILDLMLPKLGGLEVARKIRETNIRFPILMLTAKTTDEDRILGFELGADDYLTKPFHLPELLLRVKGMLRRGDWYKSWGSCSNGRQRGRRSWWRCGSRWWSRGRYERGGEYLSPGRYGRSG